MWRDWLPLSMRRCTGMWLTESRTGHTWRNSVSMSPRRLPVRYETAPVSLAIKVISTVMVALTAGLFVASFVRVVALIPAVLLGAITLGCYLRAPVAYH